MARHKREVTRAIINNTMVEKRSCNQGNEEQIVIKDAFGGVLVIVPKSKSGMINAMYNGTASRSVFGPFMTLAQKQKETAKLAKIGAKTLARTKTKPIKAKVATVKTKTKSVA